MLLINFFRILLVWEVALQFSQGILFQISYIFCTWPVFNNQPDKRQSPHLQFGQRWKLLRKILLRIFSYSVKIYRAIFEMICNQKTYVNHIRNIQKKSHCALHELCANVIITMWTQCIYAFTFTLTDWQSSILPRNVTSVQDIIFISFFFINFRMTHYMISLLIRWV